MHLGIRCSLLPRVGEAGGSKAGSPLAVRACSPLPGSYPLQQLLVLRTACPNHRGPKVAQGFTQVPNRKPWLKGCKQMPQLSQVLLEAATFERRCLRQILVSYPEGPSIQKYLEPLVPISKGMVSATRDLKYWVLGPSGLCWLRSCIGRLASRTGFKV